MALCPGVLDAECKAQMEPGARDPGSEVQGASAKTTHQRLKPGAPPAPTPCRVLDHLAPLYSVRSQELETGGTGSGVVWPPPPRKGTEGEDLESSKRSGSQWQNGGRLSV